MLNLITIILVLINLITLFYVWTTIESVARRLIWTAAVLLLPFAGAVFFFVMSDHNIIGHIINQNSDEG